MKTIISLIKNFKKTFFLTVFILFSAAAFSSPENVVALSKSVAEMWILAGGELAGTTDDGLELEGAENAVSVGSLTTSSLEAIISINPGLVILTNDIPLHKKLYSNLKTLGIKVYVADVKKFADYKKVLKDFTELTGKPDLFKKNVLEVENKINQITSNCKSSEKSTYLFLRVSAAKNKVLKDHFGNEIFENLGLTSIINDDSTLDEIGIEGILSANPDYIFVVQQGNQKNAEQAFYKAYESNPVWKELKAVKSGKMFVLPKNLFNYKPNARWDEAYQCIKNLLNNKIRGGNNE